MSNFRSDNLMSEFQKLRRETADIGLALGKKPEISFPSIVSASQLEKIIEEQAKFNKEIMEAVKKLEVERKEHQENQEKFNKEMMEAFQKHREEMKESMEYIKNEISRKPEAVHENLPTNDAKIHYQLTRDGKREWSEALEQFLFETELAIKKDTQWFSRAPIDREKIRFNDSKPRVDKTLRSAGIEDGSAVNRWEPCP